jgi:hypothetical protein
VIKPLSLLQIATLVLLAAWASAEARGPGTGTGGGKGIRNKCGSTLSVVLPDGTEKTFKPAMELFNGMPTKHIDQGESPRPAVKLFDMLAHFDAAWVKTFDCNDGVQDMPIGLPVEGEIYVVSTGRGSLKFVREVRPGVYSNIAQNIKRLRFHAATSKSQAHPEKARSLKAAGGQAR